MDRRSFLARLSNVAMTGGLIAGYGTFGAIAVRYLYPTDGSRTLWVFVTELARLAAGDVLTFALPSGESMNIARRDSAGEVSDFIALSTRCPHLGCHVHWENVDAQFVCPCHNGIFDSNGVAIAGPPFKAGQSLPKYPLRVESGLLFVEVSADQLGPAT